MNAPQTWLPVAEAAIAGGLSEKALRRRIERGTVESRVDADGRRLVLLSSVRGEGPSPTPRPAGDSPGPLSPAPATAPLPAGELTRLVDRVEQLAAEAARYKALTQVAESAEQALTDELHRTRAELAEAQALLDAERARPWWRRRRKQLPRPGGTPPGTPPADAPGNPDAS